MSNQQIEMQVADIPFANNGLATPTLYVEDIRGMAIINNVVKMTLVENRADATTGVLMSVPVASLVVPLDMLRNWPAFLIQNLPAASQEPDAPTSVPNATA